MATPPNYVVTTALSLTLTSSVLSIIGACATFACFFLIPYRSLTSEEPINNRGVSQYGMLCYDFLSIF